VAECSRYSEKLFVLFQNTVTSSAEGGF